jgi:hypothetical protein
MMAGQPPDELRCPTCGARQGLTDTCRRCKSDLRLLRLAIEAYERHRRESLHFLAAGQPELAVSHARRCHELEPGADSSRLLAVCQLLRGDWLEALALGLAQSDGTDEPASEK